MVLARFLPRDERFFDYFREAATNATEVARRLVEIFERPADVEGKVRELRDLEHRGDEITHRIFNALNSTFVTPLDREDIQALASKVDDFVDDIEEVAKRFLLYRIAEPTEPARQLARLILEQAQVMEAAIPLLERSKEHPELLRRIVDINRIENEADDALAQALAALYDGATEIPALIRAIRWGELYQLLEDATDRGEDTANALEAIVMKHA